MIHKTYLQTIQLLQTNLQLKHQEDPPSHSTFPNGTTKLKLRFTRPYFSGSWRTEHPSRMLWRNSVGWTWHNTKLRTRKMEKKKTDPLTLHHFKKNCYIISNLLHHHHFRSSWRKSSASACDATQIFCDSSRKKTAHQRYKPTAQQRVQTLVHKTYFNPFARNTKGRFPIEQPWFWDLLLKTLAPRLRKRTNVFEKKKKDLVNVCVNHLKKSNLHPDPQWISTPVKTNVEPEKGRTGKGKTSNQTIHGTQICEGLVQMEFSLDQKNGGDFQVHQPLIFQWVYLPTLTIAINHPCR